MPDTLAHAAPGVDVGADPGAQAKLHHVRVLADGVSAVDPADPAGPGVQDQGRGLGDRSGRKAEGQPEFDRHEGPPGVEAVGQPEQLHDVPAWRAQGDLAEQRSLRAEERLEVRHAPGDLQPVDHRTVQPPHRTRPLDRLAGRDDVDVALAVVLGHVLEDHGSAADERLDAGLGGVDEALDDPVPHVDTAGAVVANHVDPRASRAGPVLDDQGRSELGPQALPVLLLVAVEEVGHRDVAAAQGALHRQLVVATVSRRVQGQPGAEHAPGVRGRDDRGFGAGDHMAERSERSELTGLPARVRSTPAERRDVDRHAGRRRSHRQLAPDDVRNAERGQRGTGSRPVAHQQDPGGRRHLHRPRFSQPAGAGQAGRSLAELFHPVIDVLFPLGLLVPGRLHPELGAELVAADQLRAEGPAAIAEGAVAGHHGPAPGVGRAAQPLQDPVVGRGVGAGEVHVGAERRRRRLLPVEDQHGPAPLVLPQPIELADEPGAFLVGAWTAGGSEQIVSVDQQRHSGSALVEQAAENTPATRFLDGAAHLLEARGGTGVDRIPAQHLAVQLGRLVVAIGAGVEVAEDQVALADGRVEFDRPLQRLLGVGPPARVHREHASEIHVVLGGGVVLGHGVLEEPDRILEALLVHQRAGADIVAASQIAGLVLGGRRSRRCRALLVELLAPHRVGQGVVGLGDHREVAFGRGDQVLQWAGPESIGVEPPCEIVVGLADVVAARGRYEPQHAVVIGSVGPGEDRLELLPGDVEAGGRLDDTLGRSNRLEQHEGVDRGQVLHFVSRRSFEQLGHRTLTVAEVELVAHDLGCRGILQHQRRCRPVPLESDLRRADADAQFLGRWAGPPGQLHHQVEGRGRGERFVAEVRLARREREFVVVRPVQCRLEKLPDVPGHRGDELVQRWLALCNEVGAELLPGLLGLFACRGEGRPVHQPCPLQGDIELFLDHVGGGVDQVAALEAEQDAMLAPGCREYAGSPPSGDLGQRGEHAVVGRADGHRRPRRTSSAQARQSSA